MTPQEISAHAIELGITPELYPEFWALACPMCGHGRLEYCDFGPTDGYACDQCEAFFSSSKGLVNTCTIPDPDSDDPRCPLWDGFYMRALGWPLLRVDSSSGTLRYEGMRGQFHKTPTAALRAAWLAKGAKA